MWTITVGILKIMKSLNNNQPIQTSKIAEKLPGKFIYNTPRFNNRKLIGNLAGKLR